MNISSRLDKDLRITKKAIIESPDTSKNLSLDSISILEYVFINTDWPTAVATIQSGLLDEISRVVILTCFRQICEETCQNLSYVMI